MNRDDLLISQDLTSTKKQIIPFIITNNPLNPPITTILSKYRRILENTLIINMWTLKEKPSKLLQETHAGDQRSLNRAHGTRHPRQGPSPGLYTLYKFRQHRNRVTSTTLNQREGQADSTHTSLSP